MSELFEGIEIAEEVKSQLQERFAEQLKEKAAVIAEMASQKR